MLLTAQWAHDVGGYCWWMRNITLNSPRKKQISIRSPMNYLSPAYIFPLVPITQILNFRTNIVFTDIFKTSHVMPYSKKHLSIYQTMAWQYYRPGFVFSYKLRYIVGFWLVEMAIWTDQKPAIYRNSYENTHPGSNLNFVSEIVEKVIANRIRSHFGRTKPSIQHQSAYTLFYSTETALLKVEYDIILNKAEESVAAGMGSIHLSI